MGYDADAAIAKAKAKKKELEKTPFGVAVGKIAGTAGANMVTKVTPQIVTDTVNRRYGSPTPTVKQVQSQAEAIASHDTDMDVTTFLNQAVSDGVVTSSEAESIFRKTTGGSLFSPQNQQKVTAEYSRRINGGTPVWRTRQIQEEFGNYTPEQAKTVLEELYGKPDMTPYEREAFSYLLDKTDSATAKSYFDRAKKTSDEAYTDFEEYGSTKIYAPGYDGMPAMTDDKRNDPKMAQNKYVEYKKYKDRASSYNSIYEDLKYREDILPKIESAKSNPNYEKSANNKNSRLKEDQGYYVHHAIWIADVITGNADKGDFTADSYQYSGGAGEGDHAAYGISRSAFSTANGDFARIAEMTEDEKNTFVFILDSQGEEAAKAFFEEIAPMLDKRVYQTELTKSREKAIKNPFSASAETVIKNIHNAPEGLGTFLAELGSDKDFNAYAPGFKSQYTSEIVRGTVAENINNPIGRFLYNTGMSMADSAAVMPMGSMGIALLATNAAVAEGRKTAIEGGSKAQIFAKGIAAGAFEATFEKIGLDNLFKPRAVGGFAKALQVTLAQGGIEASEELCTSLANNFIDDILMGNESQYNKLVKEYVAKGMSIGEAQYNAMIDMGGEVLTETLAGFVSGMFFGAGGSVVNYANAANTGKQVNAKGNADVLIDYAKMQDSESTAYKDAVKLSDKKSVKNAEVGALFQQMIIDKQITEEDADRIVNEGINGIPLDEAEQAYYFAGANGISATDAVKQLSDLDVNPERAITAWKRGNEARVKENSSNLKAGTVTTEYGESLDNLIQKSMDAKVAPISRKVLPYEGDSSATPQNDKGAVIKNKGVKADAEAEVNVPETNVPTTTGKLKGEAYQKAVSLYKTNENAEDFEYAYLQGYNRVKPSEDINLEDVAMNRAYMAGVDDARVITSNRAAFESRTPGLKMGDSITRTIAERYSDATRQALHTLGKKLGVEIRLVNRGVKGSRSSAYSVSKGVIEINVDEIHSKDGKVLKGEDLIRFILNHEGTHRIRETSPEAYAKMEKIALAKTKNNLKEYMEKWGITDENEAREEIVADYFGELINSKAEVKKLLKENRTVFDAVRDALEWLGNKLGIHNSDITEARKLFKEALDEADAEAWGTEVRKSDADVLSRGEEWHPDLTKNQLDFLMKIIDNDIKKSTRHITNNANWLMTRINGMSVFAIYSTVYPYNPTLLYESKGNDATKERDLLLDLMEAEENAKNNVAKSIQLNKLLNGNEAQQSNGIQDNNAGTSFGKSNSGNGGILQGTSPEFIGSPAFRSVLQNLFEISDSGRGRDGGDGGGIIQSRSEPEKTFAKGETDFSETRVKANAVLDIEKQIKALSDKMTEENRKEIFPEIYKLYEELDKADKALEKAISNRAETIKKSKASKAPSDPKRWQTEKANRTKGKDFKVKGVSDIVSKLEHDFGIPISSGHISERNARGIYKVESEAVRTKDLNNLPTALHEVGHHLTRKFNLTDVSKDIENELIANADASFLDQYKDSEKPGEAVAEFFRNYFQNAEKAEKSYPLFTKYLFSKLDKKTADIVNENADIINNYYVEASKTATSAIKLAEEKSTDFRTVGERFSDKTNLLYQSWYDSNHAIKLFTDEVENRTAYTFATNAAYADSRAYSMVIGDLYSIDGVKVGEGLAKALENINTKNVEEYKEFGEYLICKNGIERLAEGLDVWANEIQNTEEWMSNRIKELEAKYPTFMESSERLYAFQKSFLNEWGVKSGLVSEESAKSWAERWQYYVPFTRKMETVSRISKKRNQADSTIKKAKGSKRDFQHPIDSIMFNMQKMVSAALTNRVRTEISNQAEIVPGTGYIIEKIPTPMVADNFNVSELVDELNDAFMSNFESEEDIERGYNILLSTFGEDGKITKYQRGKANGDIITILKNGKPEFYQVHDTLLLESLVDLEPSQVNPFVKAIKTVNALLTWGATGGNLTWNIFSNMPRDLGTLLAYNKKRDALKLIGGIFQAYFNKSKNALGKKTNPVYQEFLAMGGGGGSSRMTADKNYMESLRKKMGTVNKRNNPLKALLNAVEFVSDLIEAGPRYSVYKLFRETYNLTPDEAFYMSMDATTNFRRSGKYSKMINGVVPFFNAAMQGTNRFARYFTCSDLATTNPDVYYDKGKRGKAIWARSLTFVTASAIFGILRSLINSRDDEAEEAYTRLSNYVKNNYYVFYIGDIEIGDLKIDIENIRIIGKEKGKFFAIPKPREIATASSFAERMTDFIRNDDKHAFDEFYDYFTDNLTPPVIQGLVQLDLNGAINGFGVIGTASSLNANKDYMGRPIVSQSLEGLPAKEQYDRGTSKMAYWIGQASAAAGINDGEGLSPKQVDYFMSNVFGFVWKHPKALFPMNEGERDLTLGIKTKWIKDPLYSTDVTNRMYNNKDKLSRQSKANPEDFETKAELKDYTYYTDFFTKYNKLTKDENETKESREIRDKVLDILEAKEDEFESGKYDFVTEELIKIASEYADASAISSAGDVAVDVNGEPYSMTSKEYFNVETYAKDIKDEAIDKLIKSEYYNDLSWKEKSDAAEDLKVYGKEMALEKYIPGYVTDDTTSQKIKAATNNANLSPEDYILYQMALDMVDKPNKSGNLGTYTQEEASAALNVFKNMTKTDITDEALALLWQIQTDGVSYKNPYGYAIRGTNWYRPNGKDQYDKLWMKEK